MAIPRFALYGETAAPGQDMLHIESVASRSRLYHWEIEPHVHQGLYQILWLQRGSAEVVLDEWRASVAGPAAIVVPPGVVHGFVFAPETDGRVLTLSARFLVEGEFQAVGEAFQALFSAPGVLHFSPDDGEAQRLSVQLGELAAEFALPGSADAPVVQWLARAVVWRLARASEQGQREGGERAHQHQALFTRFLLLVEQHFLEHWPLERYASRLGLSTQRLNRLARANQALDEQRDHVFTLLTANVDAIEALCATRPSDAPAQVYAFASAMVDMAGYLDVPTFFEAAFSLCEIADRMKGAGVWSWPSVEVHVRALARVQERFGRSVQRRAVAGRLPQVPERLEDVGLDHRAHLLGIPASVEMLGREHDRGDLDRHAIPARGADPEHWHYDVRFVVRATGSEDFAVSEESLDLAWKPVAAIAADPAMDESMRRMATRWLTRGR